MSSIPLLGNLFDATSMLSSSNSTSKPSEDSASDPSKAQSAAPEDQEAQEWFAALEAGQSS